MARIVLATFGSLGDLHPFLALAEALAGRGHSCVVAASPIYRERVEMLGLEHADLSPDLSHAFDDPVVFHRAMDLRNGSQWIFEHLVLPSVRPNATELFAACEGTDAVVSSTLVFAAHPVAEKLGIPIVSTALQPLAMFSVNDPALMPAAPGLSRWLRGKPGLVRALNLFVRVVTQSWLREVTALRRELGLGAMRGHPLFEPWRDSAVHLAMFSRHFAPDPGDWGANVVQTGFAFFDHAPGARELRPELRAFLDAGPPPVWCAWRAACSRRTTRPTRSSSRTRRPSCTRAASAPPRR